MKFRSRVHENLDGSFNELMSQGVSPNVKLFPHKWVNTGLSGSPEEMGKKLRVYTELLIKELEEDQFNGHAWLSLGLQYVNEKDIDKAEICFERACMSSNEAYMPFREMAIIKLNKALGYVVGAKKRLNGGESVFWKEVDSIIEILQKGARPHPIINTGEGNLIEDIELPQFDYDRITIDEEGNFIVNRENE